MSSLMFCQNSVQMFGHVHCASRARFRLKVWFPKMMSLSAVSPQILASEEKQSPQDDPTVLLWQEG